MSGSLALVTGILVALSTGAGKLAVLPVQVEASAAALVPVEILSEAVVTATATIAPYEVVGQDDLNALLSFEKQKELLGCDDVKCFAEIGGALGVDVLLSMRVGLVDNEWVLASKVIDIRQAKALHRSTQFVKGDTATMLKSVPQVVAGLFGAPAAGTATSSTATPSLGLELSTFLAAGLSASDFDSFMRSGASYDLWAARRNEESTLLEVSKWVLTVGGVALAVLGYAWGVGDDGLPLIIAGVVIGPPLWVVDLADIGAVPPSLASAGAGGATSSQ